MERMTEREQSLIVKNVLASCKDISKLNKRGYNFLYLCSGFIAHYNIHGFKDYYGRQDLMQDIISNYRHNMWLNFLPHERDYAYYTSKAEVYRNILEGLGILP